MRKNPELYRPSWTNLYGAPTTDVANEDLAKDMTRGKSTRVDNITPSMWRGRLLIGLQEAFPDTPPADVKWLGPAEKAAKEARKHSALAARGPMVPHLPRKPKPQRVFKSKIKPLKPAPKGLLPFEAPFGVRVAVYGVVGISPEADKDLVSPGSMGLQISMGGWTMPAEADGFASSFGPAPMANGCISFGTCATHGLFDRSNVRESGLVLPIDASQMPDIFVYLTDSMGARRVAFTRIRASDVTSGMRGVLEHCEPQWLPLYADLAVGAFGDRGMLNGGVCAHVLIQIQLGPNCAFSHADSPKMHLWAPEFKSGERGLRLNIYRALDLPLDRRNHPCKKPELRVRFLNNVRVLSGKGPSEWYSTVSLRVPALPLELFPPLEVEVLENGQLVSSVTFDVDLKDKRGRPLTKMAAGPDGEAIQVGGACDTFSHKCPLLPHLPAPASHLMRNEYSAGKGFASGGKLILSYEKVDAVLPYGADRGPKAFATPKYKRARVQVDIVGLRCLALQNPSVSLTLGSTPEPLKVGITPDPCCDDLAPPPPRAGQERRDEPQPRGADHNFLTRTVLGVDIPTGPVFVPSRASPSSTAARSPTPRSAPRSSRSTRASPSCPAARPTRRTGRPTRSSSRAATSSSRSAWCSARTRTRARSRSPACRRSSRRARRARTTRPRPRRSASRTISASRTSSSRRRSRTRATRRRCAGGRT